MKSESISRSNSGSGQVSKRVELALRHGGMEAARGTLLEWPESDSVKVGILHDQHKMLLAR